MISHKFLCMQTTSWHSGFKFTIWCSRWSMPIPQTFSSARGYFSRVNNFNTWRWVTWTFLISSIAATFILFTFQIQSIMKPLMELSASLDTYRPNSAALFRSLSASSKSELIMNDGEEWEEIWFWFSNQMNLNEHSWARQRQFRIVSLNVSYRKRENEQQLRYEHQHHLQLEKRLGSTIPRSNDASIIQ